MSETARPISLVRDGDVAVLTLDRPDAANAIDLALADRLSEIARDLAAEGWARAIVLRGAGKMFCGGGDVGAMTAFVDAGDGAGLTAFIGDLVARFHAGLEALLALDAPLIASVHGVAAGAGMSFVLAADLAYGGPNARLVPAYPGIGFSADGGMSWFLPRVVGERKAAELLLLNQPIDAERAVALGILTERLVLDGAAFDAEVMARARQVAAGPRRAFGRIRRLLRSSAGNGLSAQLAAEAEAMVALAGGPDVAEGLAALRARRRPTFTE
jgi:2-(1,2-epoxy-1,2-dihydrophenyl)acetyl-CoA isomerase